MSDEKVGDFRLYEFRRGILFKVAGRQHKANTIRELKDNFKSRYRVNQLVIVEYTGKYKSKIVEVYEG